MDREEFDSYFKLGVSVTLIVFGFEEGKLKIFTNKINRNPYKGAWSLPGRLIRSDEGLDEVAEELLMESIGNRDVYLEQLNAFGKVTRHPLGRVVDVTFYSLINIQEDVVSYRADKEIRWIESDRLPELAYDNNSMLDLALQRLRRRLINRPIGFKLLPKEFTLNDLQELYEQILNRSLDKRNFRKKVMKLDILTECGREDTESPGRKPMLYSFNPKRYSHYMEQGF